MDNDIKEIKKFRLPTKIQQGWFLVFYIPGGHSWASSKILEFKDGKKQAIDAFIQNSKKAINVLAKEYKFDVIIRALRSSELEASGHDGLDLLGFEMAKQIGAKYLTSVLQKRRTIEPMHKIKSARERRDELKNLYFLSESSKNIDFSNKNILIIDDIFTTGATSNEIANVFKNRWPSANFFLFCLGMTYSPPK